MAALDGTIAVRVTVLSTSPTNFAGAATAHSRILRVLVRAGVDSQLVVPTAPFAVEDLRSAGIGVDFAKVHSSAYPDSDALAALAVGNRIYERALESVRQGATVVLCGTYLFPFFQAVLYAGRLLKDEGVSVRTVAIPAGSDIWQIGRQMPRAVAESLRSESCSQVIAYSQRFAAEIDAFCPRREPSMVVPPPIDPQTFAPATPDDRRRLRASLGLSQDDFVLLSCCNMRSVKRLDITIEVARRLARHTRRRVILALVGPGTDHLRESLAQADRGNGSLGNMSIRCPGLQRQTALWHQAADTAISTSVHDSFNMSIAESLATGCPVIATATNGIAELFEDEGCFHKLEYPEHAVEALNAGELVAPAAGSVEQAVDFVVSLAHRPELAHSSGVRARQRILETCAADVVAPRWLEGILGDAALSKPECPPVGLSGQERSLTPAHSQ